LGQTKNNTSLTKENSAMPNIASTQLITHSGSFHADDVLSYTLLKSLFPQSKLVRTRNQSLIDNKGANDVVFDVGYAYDPRRLCFDHHQPGRPLRIDGAPYSAFGLIWKHFGVTYLSAKFQDELDVIQRAWDEIDAGFVTEIDHGDNGYVPPNGRPLDFKTGIAQMVDAFVPAWDEDGADYDQAFKDASACVEPMLSRIAAKAMALARAYQPVRQAFDTAEDARIVVIPDFMPSGNIVYDENHIEALYLVERRRSGEWFVNCIAPEGSPFEQRLPLPEAWAGLRGQALADVTGVSDAIFCHLQRFTCSARSKEGALALANLALELSLAERFSNSDENPQPIL
jgi:uncharacterized UPF0160 family protein